MFGYGGEKVSIVTVVYPRGTVSISSLGFFLSVGSSSKPSHSSLPLYLGSLHIQEYINKKRDRKRESIKTHPEKDRHKERIKKSKVILQAKFVVGYWEFIPMEPGAELLSPHDIATGRVIKEKPAAKKQRTTWWTEENWPSLKKALVNSWYPYVGGHCGESFLKLGLDPVPKKTIFNVLQRIGRKRITYENSFPMKNAALLSERQVKYVEDIIVKRDTENLGM